MKGYLRVSTSTPNLSCENFSDLYTVASSNKGNKALTYPVGLVTTDEVVLSGSSGGVFDGNCNYQKPSPNNYLTAGNSYWTMTPAGYYNPFGNTDWGVRFFIVHPYGYLDDYYAASTIFLRPVINIRSDVTVSGLGTMQNPYTIS